ncbi:VWA domain-containing protein [Rhodobacter sp. Har01]|uniref:vWA domain-containing protein n=1 Tax=Rhodobacter sp. Har01 TaxID=2883999 RepID=UPI001D05E7FB|nr:VWA domain-containing protein [Rhodobacter sp. Har01]MCB6179140.1 VWA domain-containing protein [Rhodobacter sp. Har01]
MTEDRDPLERLKAGLKAAPPPDGEAKARALALAMENFDRLQASGPASRPKEDRPPRAGFLNGVRSMLTLLTTRPALAATTSIAALVVGVAVLLPVTEQLRSPGGPPVAPRTLAPEAPKPEASSLADAGTPPGADAPVAVTPAEPKPAASAADAAPEADSRTDQAANETLQEDALAYLTEEEMGRARKEKSEGLVGDLAAGGATMPSVAAPAAEPMPMPQLEPNTEEFATAEANPVKVTAEEPVSTFSTDIDTASYAVVRSTLDLGSLPTPDQVRVEEMVNYFPYAYPAPEAGQAFRTTVSVMPTPWNPGTRLVTIGLQGELPAVADRPPLNLVFLIDTSGSMEDPGKLGLLKQSLSLMLAELRPEDQIAIVTYAGSAGEVLPPTRAAERDRILAALDGLMAGGSTAGAEGIELAYQVAAGMAAEGEVSRVLLATDGDFNVGLSDPAGLEDFIARKRDEGVYLSVLGFGRGNLDDATMQALAQNGNGTASYIDTLSEARKVLVDQQTGALFPIADDVKVQVEWNPAQVAEYRLIGYETRALRREDFNNDAVDAGEIGAGLQVTAIYEVTAPGSDALLNDPLRYGTAAATEGAAGELGFLRLRWKAPGEGESQLVETPITGQEPATDEARFAAAIAGFGQLLTDSVYLGDWGWDQAIALALSARGDDAYGYRIEAVNLMRLAQGLDR